MYTCDGDVFPLANSFQLICLHYVSRLFLSLSLSPLWFLPQADFLIYIFNKISLPLKITTLYSLFRSFHVWLRRKSGSKYFKKMMVMSYPKQEVAAQKVKSDTRRLASFLIYKHIYTIIYRHINTYIYGNNRNMLVLCLISNPKFRQ